MASNRDGWETSFNYYQRNLDLCINGLVHSLVEGASTIVNAPKVGDILTITGDVHKGKKLLIEYVFIRRRFVLHGPLPVNAFDLVAGGTVLLCTGKPSTRKHYMCWPIDKATNSIHREKS